MLSLTLPCYEKLIVILKLLRCKLMKIAHAITASIEKLEEYLTKSRKTRIYAIAISELYAVNSLNELTSHFAAFTTSN